MEKKTFKGELIAILTVNFIGTLGFSLVVPFLVVLVDRYHGNAFVYGVVTAIYPAFQAVGAPLLGRLSDKIGRKPVLFISQVGTVLSWLIFFIALFLPNEKIITVDDSIFGRYSITLPILVIIFARFLDGLTGGNVSVAQAYLADISQGEERKKNYGYFSMSMNLGFIIGPAIAGLLSSTIYGEKLPVLGALIISAISAILILKNLPESYKAKNKSFSKLKKKELTRDVLSKRNVIVLFIASFIIFVCFNLFYVAFPVHAFSQFSWSALELGLYFTIVSALMALVNFIILPKLSKIYNDTFLVIGGALILSISFFMLKYNDIKIVYSSTIFFAIGNGLMWPSFLTLVSNSTDEEHQGAVQGINGAIMSIAGVVGLIAGGMIYNHKGSTTFVYLSLAICITPLIIFMNRKIFKNS